MSEIDIITMESINEESSKMDFQKSIIDLQKRFNDLAEKHNKTIKMFHDIGSGLHNMQGENDFRDSLIAVLLHIVNTKHNISKEEFSELWFEVHEKEIDQLILNALFN